MQLGALTEKLVVNITKIEELICSQEDALDILNSPREILQITGIARSSVVMLTDESDVLADHITASLH